MKGLHISAILLVYLTLIRSHGQSFTPLRLQLQKYGKDQLYFIEMDIGTPPQIQSMIFDTGSSLMYAQSQTCNNCLNPKQPSYNQKKSGTFEIVKCLAETPQEQLICDSKCLNKEDQEKMKPIDKCQIQLHYEDGTTVKGFLAKDVFSFKQTDREDQKFTGYFGLIQSIRTSSQMKQNGIVGFGPISFQTVIFPFLKSRNMQNSTEYTFCLTQTSGYLQIGKSAVQPQTAPDFSGQIHDQLQFLSVNITSLTLVSTNLLKLQQPSISSHQLILDSGSTLSLMPKKAHKYFQKQLLSACTQSQKCQYQQLNSLRQKVIFFQISAGSIFLQEDEAIDQILPSITLEINSAKIQWKASQYCTLLSSGSGTQQWRLDILESFVFLLGANWLQNKKVQVDLSNKKVNVWMQADCRFSTSFWVNLFKDFKHFLLSIDSGTISYVIIAIILATIVF